MRGGNGKGTPAVCVCASFRFCTYDHDDELPERVFFEKRKERTIETGQTQAEKRSKKTNKVFACFIIVL